MLNIRAVVVLNTCIPGFCLPFYFLSSPMIRLCTGYPVHNNQTRTGSLFVRPRWKNRINKSIKTIVKPKPESSDAAPLKLDYKSVVSTVTLNPRCKIILFVVSTAVWWSDFTTLKENPKADLSNGFYCGKFIFSALLMKLNHFFVLFQSSLINESKTVRRRSLILPLSVGLSVAGCLVRTQSDWLNLNSI